MKLPQLPRLRTIAIAVAYLPLLFALGTFTLEAVAYHYYMSKRLELAASLEGRIAFMNASPITRIRMIASGALTAPENSPAALMVTALEEAGHTHRSGQ